MDTKGRGACKHRDLKLLGRGVLKTGSCVHWQTLRHERDHRGDLEGELEVREGCCC